MSLPPPVPKPRSRSSWKRNLLFLGVCLLVGLLITGSLWSPRSAIQPEEASESALSQQALETVSEIDAAFEAEWSEKNLTPTPNAEEILVLRRLSLALTGTIPSLEEIRLFQQFPEEERIQGWLTRLFEDRRYSDYTAERLARAYVGTEPGPFIIYRRHRFVDWLSDELHSNRPYDELVRSLLAADGIWTTNPAANFITVAMEKNPATNRQDPDPIELTTRASRAFLGMRLDCVECHDDKFGDFWKQEHFHELAAFFAPAENSIGGVRDNPDMDYQFKYRGEREESKIAASVPFASDLMPSEGPVRERLAAWITHEENRPFARAAVNRVWAHLLGKPLVEPIDDIPLEGPWPPAMEILADEFIASGYDVQHVIRLIAETRVFQLDSRSADPDQPITAEQENAWACFPLTRLRPEQVAQSLIQSSSLHTIDAKAHVFQRIAHFGQTRDFVNRYGDAGATEFEEQAGTIPQRLLLMNGKLMNERTEENIVNNASTRIAALTDSDTQAVETAYLTVLSRKPTPPELEHFCGLLDGTKQSARAEALQDLYWALINSTEFSWNH